MCEYDYSKLRGKITEVCKTQGNFAEKMGVSENTISARMNHSTEWKQSEMLRAANVLGFEPAEIPAYFFCGRSSKPKTLESNRS